MKPFPLTCCVLCFTSFSALSELQTQHVFESSAKMGPLEPLLHFRIRTTPQGGGLAQIRTGPILNFDVHDRVTLIGGYYFIREQEERSWTTTHRWFGGAEVAVWKRGIEVDARSLLERFVVVSAPDYTRFRNRVRISPPGTTAPYVSVEASFDADGLRSMRYSAGIRRTIVEELIVDIGYFYENRRPGASPDRHVIGTTIHWRDKTTRLDADP
jgi:hypothetical protein